MSQQNGHLEISAEVTPNPNTLKFVVNRPLLEAGSVNFTSREKAQSSPLSKKLFDLENVSGVMIGPGFVTVTKTSEASWDPLIGPIAEMIRTVLQSGEEILPKEALSQAQAAGGDSEIEQKIKEVLDREIRPAVAQDGGDIIFYGYQDGVVTLHLQGSCSSCPSSVMTLKMGVENRLKQVIPQVKEVVQV